MHNRLFGGNGSSKGFTNVIELGVRQTKFPIPPPPPRGGEVGPWGNGAT